MVTEIKLQQSQLDDLNRILELLNQYKAINLSYIFNLFEKEKIKDATVLGYLDYLERSDLITRNFNGNNRRVFITAEGDSLYQNGGFQVKSVTVNKQKMFTIYFDNDYGGHNILDLDDDELKEVIKAYDEGEEKFFVAATQYYFTKLRKIRIFETTEHSSTYKPHLELQRYIERDFFKNPYISLEGLALVGSDVTKDYIKKRFGWNKEKLKAESKLEQNESSLSSSKEQIDYAIIAALYEEELNFIEPYIIDSIVLKHDLKKLIRIGKLKSDPSKKVLYASLLNTGMVDAAILATDIITRFNPKLLIMPGVCGGREGEKYNLKDITIATSVYTFQKGKETSEGFEIESEEVDLNDRSIQILKTQKTKIKEELEFEGEIHFGPMACSSMVINKAGKFEEIAKQKDRKTVAVDMESYGIARACSIANNGLTKCLIIKGIMDKTHQKTDDVKKAAAKNSAELAMKILELGIIQ